MQFLSITFAFLIIFAIFAAAQFNKLMDYTMMSSTYRQCFEKNANHLIDAVSRRAYDLKARQKGVVVNGNDKGLKPKLSRKLHIGYVLPTQDEEKDDELVKLSRELLKKLIQTTYGSQKFYQEAKGEDETFEDRLVEALFDSEKQTLIQDGKIKDVDDLANLSFASDDLSRVLYKILKGNVPAEKSEQKSDSPSNTQSFPALSDLISFENKKTLACIYLAPPQVLAVLFDQEKEGGLVEKIIQERREIYARIKNEKERGKLEEESSKFRNTFDQYLNESIPKELISFRVSKTKP